MLPFDLESHTADMIVMPVPKMPKMIPVPKKARPFALMPRVMIMHEGKINCIAAPTVDPIIEMTKLISSPSYLSAKANARVKNEIALVIVT